MDENLLLTQFDKLIAAIHFLFTKTQLNEEILNKLKADFFTKADEIKRLIDVGKVKTIPFERAAIQLADICQRLYFATENKINKNGFLDQSRVICSFFSCINIAIELNSKIFYLKADETNQNISFLDTNYQNTVIFDYHPS